MEKDEAITTARDDQRGSVSPVPTGGFWARTKAGLTLEVEPSELAPPGTNWSNKDLDPVPLEQQKWGMWNFIAYWISDAFSISNWRIGASLIAMGLSWKLAIAAVVIGNLITAFVVTFNGVIGARLHIPFSIQARSAFGFYFSYLMVLIRVVVSIFWYGIGTYTGAECVQTIIYTWAPSFRDIPNHLPESANITTGFMICYLIYFLMVLPFHWIPTHQLHWIFTIKAIVTPIAGFAIMGWAIRSTGGGDQVFQFGNSFSGAKLGWAFMNAVNAMVGNFATLGVNMNDFARYSRNPRAPYIQLIVIPIAFLIITLMGIISANGSRIIYGEVLWDPMSIVNNWALESAGGRAAAFFVAVAFLFANIGINISANSVSVAVDLSTLLPKYLNLRRAQFVCAFLGAWCMTPWNILASAESLLTFMDGYGVWLAPISAILIADYWIINNQRVDVPDMYRPDGIYSYEKWGTNWRALVAFFVAWVPLMPGFAHAITPSTVVSDGAINLYDLGYIYSFLVATVLYVGLSYAFPPKSEHTGKKIKDSLVQDESRV